MNIIPANDSVDVVIQSWNNAPSYYKRWKELNINEGVVLNHLVGDLRPNSSYTVRINGEIYGIYTTNNNGEISFSYTYQSNGQPEKTIEIIKFGIGKPLLMEPIS